MSSFSLSGEVYPGLKVKGDYKKLKILVEDVPDNKAGLTAESIERAVKLKLLSNGIKPAPGVQPHFLYIDVFIGRDGTYYSISINLEKYSFSYGVDESVAGIRFIPTQGSYGSIGKAGMDSSFVVNHVVRRVGDFLLDYLESNIE